MNEALLEKERLARKNGDLPSLKNIFMEMLKSCSTDKEVVSLIKILSVRRGQSQEGIRWLVNEVYNKDEKFTKLLLSEVVEGKMYLERERVFFTLDLMKKCTSSQEALDIILDVPIETFTLVDDKTIINYQLEQFRLCIEVKDWIKASIIMKRIRMKYFEENNAIEEKYKFYKYKIELLLGQKKYYEASEAYLEIGNDNNNEIGSENIVMASFFAIISRNMNLLDILFNNKNNTESMRIIIEKFTSDLLIKYDIIRDINISNINIYESELKEAINDHNYRIIEKYYSIINMNTFTELMNISEEELVNKISSMVNNKESVCKINQREGTVIFGGKKWNEGVDDVMNKLIRVDHLIHTERISK